MKTGNIIFRAFPAMPIAAAVLGLVMVLWRGLGVPRFFAWLWLSFALLMVALSYVAIVPVERSARRALESGDFKIVEGEVRNFRPMVRGSKEDESFEVGGAPFRYGDGKVSAGFEKTAWQGGPIREGLPVRITYRDKTILRLEVRADHMPAVAKHVEIARHEQNQALQKLPMLGGMVALTLIVLLWNLDWRHYSRYAPFLSERVFRGFALLCFVSAAWSLMETAVKGMPKDHDYALDLAFGAVALGMFLVFDGFQRWRLRRRK